MASATKSKWSSGVRRMPGDNDTVAVSHVSLQCPECGWHQGVELDTNSDEFDCRGCYRRIAVSVEVR